VRQGPPGWPGARPAPDIHRRHAAARGATDPAPARVLRSPATPPVLVRQLLDPALAQYAYLVGCPRSGEAIVFDPERDIDRYLALAARHKLRIVAAADTHIHADYLTGLREFAERGVTVYASAEGGEAWQYEWLRGSAYPHRLLRDGDRFTVGNIEIGRAHV